MCKLHALRTIVLSTLASTGLVAATLPAFAACPSSADKGTASLDTAGSTTTGQYYPAKPVRVITGGPGTTVDILSRQLGQQLSECWGRSVVIENRGGAGLTIGTAIAAKSAPDGYTLLMADRTALAVAPNLHKGLSYVPLKDFAPITLVADTAFLLVAHPSFPAATAREFIDHARLHPGTINMAIAGPGTGNHIATELFKQMAGVKLVAVQYKGGAASTIGIMSGEAQAGFSAMPVALPHVRASKMRAYATTGRNRFSGASDIPTVTESGLPGYETGNWAGMLAPAGVPAALIARLNRDVIEIMKSSGMRTVFLAQGTVPAPQSVAEFAAFIRSETAKMKKVIDLAGLRVE